jgi:hypothetical protein
MRRRKRKRESDSQPNHLNPRVVHRGSPDRPAESACLKPPGPAGTLALLTLDQPGGKERAFDDEDGPRGVGIPDGNRKQWRGIRSVSSSQIAQVLSPEDEFKRPSEKESERQRCSTAKWEEIPRKGRTKHTCLLYLLCESRVKKGGRTRQTRRTEVSPLFTAVLPNITAYPAAKTAKRFLARDHPAEAASSSRGGLSGSWDGTCRLFLGSFYQE